MNDKIDDTSIGIWQTILITVFYVFCFWIIEHVFWTMPTLVLFFIMSVYAISLAYLNYEGIWNNHITTVINDLLKVVWKWLPVFILLALVSLYFFDDLRYIWNRNYFPEWTWLYSCNWKVDVPASECTK